MSVLIKGMKMPASCPECQMADTAMFCCLTRKTYNWGLVERPSDCPLVEIPPHGRLIDADALDDAFTNLRWTNGDYETGQLAHWGDRPHWWVRGSEVEGLLTTAPTVIKAEESE